MVGLALLPDTGGWPTFASPMQPARRVIRSFAVRAAANIFIIIAALACAAQFSCNRKTPDRKDATSPRVASLVPSATDLIVGMGAGDHLVAVSNFEVDRLETRGLPRVGDFQEVDWEQLAVCRAEVMIVFMSEDRLPQGLRDRAQQMNLRLVNVRPETLADVFTELHKLGDVVHEPQKAAAAAMVVQGQLDSVKHRVAGRPTVSGLIVREADGSGFAGTQNFLDDLLNLAGGTNAVRAAGWPSLDAEMVQSLDPEVIFLLLPGASRQVIDDAQRLWASRPNLRAVRNGRVVLLTDSWVLQPGIHVGDLAERFAAALHPEAATRPTTLRGLQ